MKTNNLTISRQRGAATLLTAVVLIISVTLVTFLTAKTVLTETKMSASNYRTSQALAAANAGMDYALAFFGDTSTTFACNAPPVALIGPPARPAWIANYLLPLANGRARVCIDNTTARPYTTPSYPASTLAPWGVTVNTACVTVNGATTAGMIISTGYSDDGIAQRTMTQCVGNRSLMGGNGPAQSLVSGGSVGLTGSAQLINRYNDINIWSGGPVDLNSGAIETYIRPVDLEITSTTTPTGTALASDWLTTTQTSPSIPNVQKVSNSGLGTGTDIYADDGKLATAKAATVANKAAGGAGDGPGTFFDMFFPGVAKAEIARSAQSTGQYFASGASSSNLDGKTGIIYVQGNASFGGNNGIGTATSPALLLVDGDFDLTGGDIFGVIYVTGQLTGAGSPKISGSIVTENGVNRGAGTVTLVYRPFGVGTGTGGITPGLTGVIAGSLRDW
ncbi:MAG: hypothetical protein Q8Q50_09720 [Methylobacter sp.]|nr:hypothetical protein [Methylobacter sp.]